MARKRHKNTKKISESSREPQKGLRIQQRLEKVALLSKTRENIAKMKGDLFAKAKNPLNV